MVGLAGFVEGLARVVARSVAGSEAGSVAGSAWFATRWAVARGMEGSHQGASAPPPLEYSFISGALHSVSRSASTAGCTAGWSCTSAPTLVLPTPHPSHPLLHTDIINSPNLGRTQNKQTKVSQCGKLWVMTPPLLHIDVLNISNISDKQIFQDGRRGAEINFKPLDEGKLGKCLSSLPSRLKCI